MAACRVEVFRPDHLIGFQAQPAQQSELQHLQGLTEEHWHRLALEGPVRTVLRDTSVIAIGGLIQRWQGRAELWLVLGDNLTRSDMLFMYRTVSTFLDECQKDPAYRRLETTALEGFEPEHRWLRMLGFSAEAVMPAYDPDGQTHWLYSRIAQWPESHRSHWSPPEEVSSEGLEVSNRPVSSSRQPSRMPSLPQR